MGHVDAHNISYVPTFLMMLNLVESILYRQFCLQRGWQQRVTVTQYNLGLEIRVGVRRGQYFIVFGLGDTINAEITHRRGLL